MFHFVWYIVLQMFQGILLPVRSIIGTIFVHFLKLCKLNDALSAFVSFDSVYFTDFHIFCGSYSPGPQFTKYLTIYHKIIVRLIYDSDLKHAKIYEHCLRRSYNFASESYLRKALCPS